MTEEPGLLPTVFVVDDDANARAELRAVLEGAGHRVESFGEAQTFLGHLQHACTGCIVLDLQLSNDGGTDVLTELARRDCHLPIVFLTDEGNVPMTVTAMKAGASDVLARPVESKALLERVSQGLAADAFRREVMAAGQQQLALLTHREREVMVLVAEGLSNKDIGQRLGISYRTVEVHRSRVMHKTRAGNVLELAKFVERLRRDALLG